MVTLNECPSRAHEAAMQWPQTIQILGARTSKVLSGTAADPAIAAILVAWPSSIAAKTALTALVVAL